MSIGDFPESLSQAILVGRFLVGRLGVVPVVLRPPTSLLGCHRQAAGALTAAGTGRVASKTWVFAGCLAAWLPGCMALRLPGCPGCPSCSGCPGCPGLTTPSPPRPCTLGLLPARPTPLVPRGVPQPICADGDRATSFAQGQDR